MSNGAEQKKNANGLNPRQLQFVKEYLAGEHAGNATRAYMKAYGVVNEASAQASSSYLLSTPMVRSVVEQFYAEAFEELRDWVELVPEVKARLVALMRTARSESVRTKAMEIILDRALGKPDQKINVEEERERVSRAVQTFAGRVARTDREIN